MNPLAAPWGVEMALVTWRSVRQHKRPPFPSEYLATFLVFGAFSVLADSQPKLAQLLGWGMVTATFLNLFPNPGSKPNQPVAPIPVSRRPVTGEPVSSGSLGSVTAPKFVP